MGEARLSHNLQEAASEDRAPLDLDSDDLKALLALDRDGWLEEIPLIREHYARFGDRMPQALLDELDQLEERLKAS